MATRYDPSQSVVRCKVVDPPTSFSKEFFEIANPVRKWPSPTASGELVSTVAWFLIKAWINTPDRKDTDFGFGAIWTCKLSPASKLINHATFAGVVIASTAWGIMLRRAVEVRPSHWELDMAGSHAIRW